MNEPLKFCVDCKQAWQPNPNSPWRCNHPSLPALPRNLVTGEGEEWYCAVVRAPGGRCGPKGSLYERKAVDNPPFVAEHFEESSDSVTGAGDK